jgi:hypothetical protein
MPEPALNLAGLLAQIDALHGIVLRPAGPKMHGENQVSRPWPEPTRPAWVGPLHSPHLGGHQPDQAPG